MGFTGVGVGVVQINARADIFAALCVAAPEPRTDTDIAVMNATTGVRLILPPSVNSTGEERHPNITQDGTRLVFERADAGNTRIIVVDLVTGASADMFTGFEVALSRPEDLRSLPTARRWLLADSSCCATLRTIPRSRSPTCNHSLPGHFRIPRRSSSIAETIQGSRLRIWP